MSKWKKAKERLQSCPEDYKSKELVDFLVSLGYVRIKSEKEEMSNFVLYDETEDRMFLFPMEDYAGKYVLQSLKRLLEENGDI